MRLHFSLSAHVCALRKQTTSHKVQTLFQMSTLKEPAVMERDSTTVQIVAHTFGQSFFKGIYEVYSWSVKLLRPLLLVHALSSGKVCFCFLLFLSNTRTGGRTSQIITSTLEKTAWWWSGTRTASGTTCPATTTCHLPARKAQVRWFRTSASAGCLPAVWCRGGSVQRVYQSLLADNSHNIQYHKY